MGRSRKGVYAPSHEQPTITIADWDREFAQVDRQRAEIARVEARALEAARAERNPPSAEQQILERITALEAHAQATEARLAGLGEMLKGLAER